MGGGGGGREGEKKNPSQLWMDGSFYFSTDLSFKKAKKIPLGKSQIHQTRFNGITTHI